MGKDPAFVQGHRVLGVVQGPTDVVDSRDHSRAVLARFDREPPDHPLVTPVQVRRGLVQEDHPGFLGKRTCDRDALGFASADLVQPFVSQVQAVRLTHRHLGGLVVFRRLDDARAMGKATGKDCLADRKAKHRCACLRHQRDGPGQGPAI